MTDWDPIQAYLMEFARQLPDQGSRANRALHEVEDHLRDVVDELCRQGIEPATAVRTAIARFGTPSEIWRQFEAQAPIESEAVTMIRYVLTVVTVLATLFGAMFLILSWFDDAPPAMLMAKEVVSVLIVGSSLMLLYQLWAIKPLQRWVRGFAVAGALLSIAIGSAGAVWTAHLGLVTGDWEGYGFVGGGLLILQGVLATVQAHSGRRSSANVAA